MPDVTAADVTIDSLLIDGKVMRSEVANAIIGARLTRSIDGVPTLSIDLHDPRKVLVSGQSGGTGFFAERKTCQFDGKAFELVSLSKSGSTLTVTFEALAAAEMRRHTDPVSVEAGAMTRVEFARKLLDEPNCGWIILSVHPNAPQEKTKVQLARGTILTDGTSGGDPSDYGGTPVSSSGGGALTGPQVAKVAQQAGFSGQNLVIAVAVSKAESGWIPTRRNDGLNKDGSVDFGLWQINGSAHKDLVKGDNWKDPVANAQMAFKISGGGTNWKPWSVYKSGAYKQYMTEAQAAVNGIGSAGTITGSVTGTASQRNSLAKQQAFGTAEDTWTCIKQIFSDINWRAYVDFTNDNKAVVVVGPDSAFLSNPIELNWTEDSPGVDTIDFQLDIGKPTGSAQIRCRATRWQLPPGTAVNLAEQGLPNPWLVQTIDRDLFSADCDVTLMIPEPALPEPDADSSGGDPSDYEGLIDALTGQPAPENFNTGGDGEWQMPLGGTIKIISPYGPRSSGFHHGIDFDAKVGTAVYAARSGTIAQAGFIDPSGYGNAVYITHRSTGDDATMGPVASNEESRYGHLSKIIVAKGGVVNKGDLIGLSGGAKGAPGAGNSQGPHLHFEIRRNGQAVDPTNYLANKVPYLPPGTNF